ncbi:unnamed protein product [Nezara viridula]|uniref:Uncharacterized protein n=1 Tax=Nezara viridula TaxID=85310 RepID=A0A9P0MX42_NEZVI|nr:unnamed protein product [Nezara viridula]
MEISHPALLQSPPNGHVNGGYVGYENNELTGEFRRLHNAALRYLYSVYIIESSDLQFAIYSSDWYKADTKFRTDAQMMMTRAMKGETLTAIRMYPINVETIMSILHFTYSASAVLSRMAE